MGGGENPTYSLIFSKMSEYVFILVYDLFYIHMHIHGVKKVGCRHSMYRRSG